MKRRDFFRAGGALAATAVLTRPTLATAQSADASDAEEPTKIARFYCLMGVAEYADASQNLRGPVNDVLDTLRLLLRMGADLSNAAVITSPKLDISTVADFYAASATDADAARQYAKSALSAVLFSEASRSGMVNTVITLGQRMNAAEGTPNLLLTWSGHTVTESNVLMFCPSDYAPGVVRAWAYDGLIGTMGIDRLGNPTSDAIPRSDQSVFAIIDACHSGSVGEFTAQYPHRDVVLTASSSSLEVYERLLGGAWRGLLSWAVNRVLEQYGMVGGDALESGFEISYGGLLQAARALTMAIQGVTTRAAVPELYGVVSRDSSTLHMRVLQDLSVAAGGTSQHATLVGGDVQLWGDVDQLTVYEVYLTRGGTESLWSRVVFYRNHVGVNVSYTTAEGARTFVANQEYWYFQQTPGLTPVTRVRFKVAERYPVSNPGAVSGVGNIDAAVTMNTVIDAPVFPPWAAIPLGALVGGYLKEDNTGYAIRITNTRIDWIRPATGPSPFENTPVGTSITFQTAITQTQTSHVHCAAILTT